MKKHFTKKEWLEWFDRYDHTNTRRFWFEYLSFKSNNNIIGTKNHFITKYKAYTKYGDIVLTRRKRGPNKPKDNSEKYKKILESITTGHIPLMSKQERIQRAKFVMKDFNKRELAKMFGISVSSLYTKTHKKRPKMNKEWMDLIKWIFKFNHTIHGRVRIAKCLEDFGINISDRTVGRYMKFLNLKCRTRQEGKKRESKTTKNVDIPDLVQRDYNNLNVIATDVTYIPNVTPEGNHIYLSAMINHLTKEIISINISTKNDLALVMKHFDDIKVTKDTIIHSDHGSVYSSNEFRNKIKELGCKQSMSRVGNSLDNREIEYFFSILKGEWLNHYKTYNMPFEELKKLINYSIYWYNNIRKQICLGWMTPIEKRKGLL